MCPIASGSSSTSSGGSLALASGDGNTSGGAVTIEGGDGSTATGGSVAYSPTSTAKATVMVVTYITEIDGG
jgi:hypothetical protein